MNYYELTFTVGLLRNIHFSETNEKIGQIINKVMFEDNELMKFHVEKGYKYYCYSSFYPIEKEGNYKAGRVYVFKMRSFDKNFVLKIKDLLKVSKNDLFTTIAIQMKTYNQAYISNLYSVTPVVVTLENGFNWVKEDDFILLQNRLQVNLEKKFNDYFNEKLKPEKSLIQRIELMNQKPMVIKYKNTKIFGNKFKVWLNDDEISQKLAFTAMACGLGEKNSAIGMGFCMGGERVK